MRTTIALNGMLRDQLRPHAASLIASVSRLIAAAIRFFPRAPSLDEREEPFELVTFGDGGRFARQSADRACAWSEAEDRERYGTTHTDGQGRAMTGRELVQKLKDMRRTAKRGEVSATKVLFGILFDDDIAKSGTNAAQISREAGLDGWDVEINYGRKLAQYVTVKPEIEQHWRRGGR